MISGINIVLVHFKPSCQNYDNVSILTKESELGKCISISCAVFVLEA